MTIELILLLLLIIVGFFFYIEKKKDNRLKSSLYENEVALIKEKDLSNIIFKNIHAFVLLIDRNFFVKKTNYYTLTDQVVPVGKYRVGEMLRCENALAAGQCGMHEKCKACAVRNAIEKSFVQKKSFENVQAFLNLVTSDTTSVKFNGDVSGIYFSNENQDYMVVTVYDMTRQWEEVKEKYHIQDAMSSISEMAKIGFGYIDLSNGRELSSPIFMTNLGESPDTAKSVKDVIKTFSHVVEEDRVALIDYVEKASVSSVEYFEKEVRIQKDGDALHWIKVSMFQQRTQGGLLLYIITLDINDDKQAEQKLEKSEKEAREISRQKSVFLADMSHDISISLSAIVDFSELLAKDASQEDKDEYLSIIRSNDETLRDLMNNIIMQSQMEAGLLDFIYSEFELNQLMKDLYDSFLDGGKKKETVDFILNCPEQTCFVKTDCNRLMQVLSYYVTNALSFTEKGKVEIGYDITENGIYFFVSDTGCGMSDEEKDRIFNHYMSLSSIKEDGGIGMQMAFCKKIVEKLGGVSGVDSVVGEGSNCWFTLPSSCIIGQEENI